MPRLASRENERLLQRATEHLQRGDHERARRAIRKALRRAPNDAALLTRYADAFYQQQKIDEARETYRRALARDEGQFQAWYGCGMAEFSLGAYASAIDCLRHAIALEPRDADARFYLGKSFFQMGEIDLAIEQLRAAAKTKEKALRAQALRQIAVIIPGSPSRGNLEILRARREWARLVEEKERPGKWRCRRRMKPGKVRIGYVGSFFQDRNWMKPVWGVINRHDRSRFEVHLFGDGWNGSGESGYERKTGDRVHNISGLSNGQAAAQIGAARMDVLVDLNGYSAPERLALYMRKPAPVVVAWFGVYGTTGIRAFDYIIGDGCVVPGEEDGYYSERVLRVCESYMAFRVLYPVPRVSPPPCLRSGRITFGCLAPQYKITPEMIATWSRILAASSGAKLLLKNVCLQHEANRKAVHERFERHGIARERVLLEGPAEHYEFLKAYGRVDIALDTFPYNGGTTTAEALWQGVPVLAVDGDRWASRISKSILGAAGLGDWVAGSREAYIQRAVELTGLQETPKKLEELRSGMRGRLLGSAACDSERLCRELEGHYRDVVLTR